MYHVHGSLLPKYRGGSHPMGHPEGEKTTGVTIIDGFRMGHGDVLTSGGVLAKDETGGSLHDKLAQLGAEALLEALDALVQGQITPQPQDDSQATLAPKLTKELGRIQWEKPAENLERLVRAMNPWPLAYCTHRGMSLRVWRAVAEAAEHEALPGTVLRVDPERGIGVACGEGILYLTAVNSRPKDPYRQGLYQRLRDYPGGGSG